MQDLYAEGITHDAAQPNRLLKRRNLEPVTAELLSLIVRIVGARQAPRRTGGAADPFNPQHFSPYAQ